MKQTVLAVVLGTALGFASSAQAGVVVDLFNDPSGGQQAVATSVTGAGGTSYDQAGPFATSNVVGGYRDLQITKTGGDDPNFGESSLKVFGGALRLSNDDGNTSIGLVTWDGNDAANSVNTTGLGGVNFTLNGADRFLATVLRVDLGFDYKIRVWDMDGSSATLSASVQFPVSSATDSDYLFSWFNLGNGSYNLGGLMFKIEDTTAGGMAGIDFSKIGALQLELSNASTVSVDLSIGNIETNRTPEPGSLALLGIGLLGAAAARRKQRQQ